MQNYDKDIMNRVLLCRKEKLIKKLKLVKPAQAAANIGILAIPAVASACLTAGTLKVLDIKPFTLEDNKVYEKCVTELTYDDNTSYKTYSYEDHNSFIHGDKYDDTVDLTVNNYSEWVAIDDHYERTVTKYKAEKNIDFKDYMQEAIGTINTSDLADWDMKQVEQYQLEGYNLSEEELLDTARLEIIASYVDGLCTKKETVVEDLKELYVAALICSFYSCFGYFTEAMIDLSLKQKKKSLDHIFNNKRKNIINEIKETNNKIKFLNEEEENTITR